MATTNSKSREGIGGFVFEVKILLYAQTDLRIFQVKILLHTNSEIGEKVFENVTCYAALLHFPKCYDSFLLVTEFTEAPVLAQRSRRRDWNARRVIS